jgi:CBS domain-containing protein
MVEAPVQSKALSRLKRHVQPIDATLGTCPCRGLIHRATCLDLDLGTSSALAVLGQRGETSGLVVDDNTVLLGVVDLSTLARLRDNGCDDFEVEDAMRTDLVTAAPSSTVAEVAQLMAQNNLDRLPIVTSNRRLVGVVEAMDVVRWLADQL